MRDKSKIGFEITYKVKHRIYLNIIIKILSKIIIQHFHKQTCCQLLPQNFIHFSACPDWRLQITIENAEIEHKIHSFFNKKTF